MMSGVSTARFYDELAATYHALYPDWEKEVRDQAHALTRLLGSPPPGSAIADTACGIGTQLLGLSEAGYHVFGSDVSRAAVHRARAECVQRGLVARVVVADMRALPWPDASMDAAICADNAIPHLLTDDEVTRAFAELRRVLRPGARLAVTIRDYDAALRERPGSTAPQVMDTPALARMITFQLWTWRGTGDIYDLEHFQLSPADEGEWTTARRTATYRAYTREHLLEMAKRAGLGRARWLTPDEAEYFQPVMMAVCPTNESPGTT
jgi:SAM-dependent methyltransferase